jgi:hypothetical protein
MRKSPDSGLIHAGLLNTGQLESHFHRFGNPSRFIQGRKDSKWQIFHTSGTCKSDHDPEVIIAILADEPFIRLDLTELGAATPLIHPMQHKDPFDDTLLVQAQLHGLWLLTQDRQLQSHPLAYFV